MRPYKIRTIFAVGGANDHMAVCGEDKTSSFAGTTPLREGGHGRIGLALPSRGGLVDKWHRCTSCLLGICLRGRPGAQGPLSWKKTRLAEIMPGWDS